MCWRVCTARPPHYSVTIKLLEQSTTWLYATRLQELSECADWGPLREGMSCDLVLCCVYGMSATGCWAARCNRVMIERLYEL